MEKGRGMNMKLKNVLLVVSDLERSIKFYKTLFGLEPIRNLGKNVILTPSSPGLGMGLRVEATLAERPRVPEQR